MTIAPERLRLALDQLDQDDGFEFERFANEFLATELPALRPVGGVHDGGRDAFIYSSEVAIDRAIEKGITDKPVDPDKVVDFSLVKELGLK